MKKIILFTLVSILLACSQTNQKKLNYEDQIGDTPFNSILDKKDFKFCDSSNVLHKRAYVSYIGGTKALAEELLDRFKFKSEYESFNGYFIIRFVINCNDEAGRFRTQILDSNFEPIIYPPKELERHILSIVKELKGWNHAIYQNKHYDCYKFINIKFKNGQIQTL